ncbi:SDR family NAD(P)-dependent oxidoreductase [Rhizobium oryzicola]|uniref:SDR family oxidoreductase n=1 Tax=Rhizobium oryzicola TaxID=1232668 RepID=A0ABT8SY79_9HYPH|nr:SDR family oxidoreductase [Rhizobium oryzicola]MDO1583425.1 SDR family oxidoreductase [Rhizobium oryzicola]
MYFEKAKPLAGKIAFLTSADAGIGPATACALAESGADLAVSVSAGRPEPGFISVLRARGTKVTVFQIPTPFNSEECIRLVRRVIGAVGRLDVVVVNCERKFQWQVDDLDLDEDALEMQFAINVRASIAVIRTAIKGMNDHGRVIAIGSSVADRVGTPGLADYAATRAAIVAFCKGAAHDVGPRGITVNVVQLGAIDALLHGAPETQIEAEMEANAMKRLGSAEEAAGAITFLASPAASFITGTIFNIDGGYSA